MVLVVVDTLRADRLKAYAETRVEMPWLTAAAAALLGSAALFVDRQPLASA